MGTAKGYTIEYFASRGSSIGKSAAEAMSDTRPASEGGERDLLQASPQASPTAPRTWTIRLDDWHPTPLNKLMGSHWGTASKLKKGDAERLAAEVLFGGIAKAASKRRVDLHIVLAPRQRACDPDAYWKSLLDGLVACGALKNDSRQWCVATRPTFSRGEKKITFITISE